jgi:hypothetical protein
MSVIDWTKRRFHRDVVSDPAVHGWVLNLYRAGERYPQTVGDYFPAQHAPDAQLAADLVRHRGDEARHTAMYGRAIERMGQPVVEMADDDIYNVVIRDFTTESFTIDDGDSSDTKRRRLAHFLAHAHFLEKRIARSLQYHRDACEHGGALVAERVVEAVLRDEERHVSYTAAAARALLTRAEAGHVFDHHRRAEARANLLFSRRQVTAFVGRFGRRPAFYRFCGFVMEQAASYV